MILAECLLIRDENHLLLEHLICNAIAGVERFYIYDNLSAVAVSDFLQENAPDLLPLCEIMRYKGCDNLQIDCYADYLSAHRDEVEWSVFCDTDEIFEGSIYDAITEFGDRYNCLSFSPILHGCNGHLQRPSGGTMQELYGGDILSRAHHWYKVCARTADITVQRPHNNTMINKRMVYLTADNCPQCVLHHYRFRSFEDYIVKMQRGTCLAEGSWHKINDFFACHKNIRPDHPYVSALMQQYGVDVNFEQKYKN